jgi:NADH:ubiquinone oxidoreductase subunit 6 (subunit J)
MKRWAIYTSLLYALALLLLSLPMILICFQVSLANAATIYANWPYWLWLAIMVTGQFLLLLLPINIAERRLPVRRKLKIPVIVTAFFLANLCLAGLISLLCASQNTTS